MNISVTKDFLFHNTLKATVFNGPCLNTINDIGKHLVLFFFRYFVSIISSHVRFIVPMIQFISRDPYFICNLIPINFDFLQLLMQKLVVLL